MKIVEVVWNDSTSTQGWDSTPDMELCSCKTVGYLIQKTKGKVILAQSLGDGMPYYNKFAIPRGCIVSITELQAQSQTPP